MNRVLQSPWAERDLDDIWDYVAGYDPVAADRPLDRLMTKLHPLAEYPRMGRRQIDIGDDLRSFTVGRYVILYQPLPDGIRLIRVLHGARDIATTLHTD